MAQDLEMFGINYFEIKVRGVARMTLHAGSVGYSLCSQYTTVILVSKLCIEGSLRNGQ